MSSLQCQSGSAKTALAGWHSGTVLAVGASNISRLEPSKILQALLTLTFFSSLKHYIFNHPPTAIFEISFCIDRSRFAKPPSPRWIRRIVASLTTHRTTYNPVPIPVACCTDCWIAGLLLCFQFDITGPHRTDTNSIIPPTFPWVLNKTHPGEPRLLAFRGNWLQQKKLS